MERMNIVVFVLSLLGVLLIVLLQFCVIFGVFATITGQHSITTTTFSPTTTTILWNRTVKFYPLKREYGQNDLRFNSTNSGFGIFSNRTSPAMVFQDGGLYNFTLYVVYDEGVCKKENISQGTIHLSVKRFEDYSDIINFTENFFKQTNKEWVNHAYLPFETRFRPGQGLLINTNYIDCVLWNKTFISVTKVSV